MATRTGNTRTFTVSFPASLADQVESLAAREHRTTSELFREALRSYRAEYLRSTLEQMHLKAKALGGAEYTQDEIESFVDEIRAERFNAK
jgi:metal-responsive CopG/Arc/MetJ family transcriptional regulator